MPQGPAPLPSFMTTMSENGNRSSLDKTSTHSGFLHSRPPSSKEESSEHNAPQPLQPDKEKNQPVATLADFPEGGLRAWLTVLGGCIVTFCTFGVVQSFGVYQDYYTRHTLQSLSAPKISLIGSMQVFLLFAVGLPAGRWFDMGYFHHCLISGTVIYTFSLFMLSLVKPHHYYQNLLAQGVGMGLGMGLMFLPSLTITSHYFRRKRSMAMGLVVAGSSLGGVVYPILLNNVFPRPSGFAWGVRAVGFMNFGLLIIANLIMKTRLPPKKRVHGEGTTFRKVLGDTPFLIYMLGAFLVFWGVFVPFFYLQLYTALHDVNPTLTKYSITIMNVASIFGRTIPNIVADHIGPLNVIIPSALISGGLVFGMLGAVNVAGVVCFGIFYGFFSGGMISIVAPCAGSFVTQPDLSDLGIRISMLSFVLAIALLTGNPIAGALLTSEHHWRSPLIFAAVAIFLGAACHLMIWKKISLRRGSAKI
ncbi:MFS general substrate transporter [Panaeolus papilionaceus]|nr:MFS general substrate transporter [Panaeolus papilionaceus]